jgi:aryl-alcohol dehydrogenase-like predicted oxidoreductase
MDHRQLGTSDIQVTPITLGAWAIGGWMWGGQERQDALDAIHTSIEMGVDTIDTAAVYGFGRSEELVGEAIRGKRDELTVLTKFGLRWDRPGEGEKAFETEDLDGNPVTLYRNCKPDSVIEECERSLKRLGVDVIDVYQAHWPDATTPIEETFEAVAKLIEQGKVRAAGASNYSVEQLQRARSVCPLASDQPPYSMVNRDIEDDLLPWCRENDLGVVCYSPLQRGLLTGKITTDYEFDEGDHRAGSKFFQAESVKRVNAFLDRIKPIAEEHDATLAQLVINWTTRQPGITAALVGARNTKQATENAQALSFTLSDEELATINRHLDQLQLEL